MVVEGADGGIAIYKGDGNGNFTTNIGGTAANTNALSGNGGHLAAISNIDGNGLIEILTTTPIGLSVLENSGSYSPNYTRKNIYDIGPGHSSFALAPFYGGNPLLAVDSAEGVALIQGNADGSFNTSLAYSAQAPALGATVGQFRPLGSNPTNNVDVVVATATNAVQGQLLIGNGKGTFNALPGTTNPLASLMANPPPANLWSNILYGDFNGDGKLDLAYSLTGTPGSYSGPGLYVQYGVGDGTFQPPVAVTPSGAPGSNTLFGESAVGLFDKSGNTGIANIDANYDDMLLGLSGGGFSLGQNLPVKSNTNFNQVAAGYIKTGSSYQDLVFQQGAATLVPYKIKQDGSGMFTAGNPLTVPSPVGNYAISTVLLTDIDGDGYGDILALYHNLASIPSDPSDTTPNYLYIWWGDGTGNFSKTPFTLSLTRNYYLAAVADMNGDTLPDIVLSDGYLVSILYNQGGLGSPVNHSFSLDSPDTHFLAGQGINSLTLQNVSGGKVPDLVVANGGATISNPIVLGGVAQTSATLPANPPDDKHRRHHRAAEQHHRAADDGKAHGDSRAEQHRGRIHHHRNADSDSGNTPTGTITFYIDGTATTGRYALASRCQHGNDLHAQCPVPAGNIYGGGPHTLTAFYRGDPNNAQTTLTGTHDIIANVATTTVLSLCIGGSSPNCPVTGRPTGTLTVVPSLSMTYGQECNGTETITANDGSKFAGMGNA